MSALSMTAVDTSSQKIAEDLIELGERQQLADIWNFWVALTSFDDGGESPRDDSSRFELAMTFFACRKTAAMTMVEAVWARKKRVHPRIQLLPFLRGGKMLASFAELVLSKVSGDESPGTGHPVFKSLSKKDVQLVLQLSPFQLSQAIEGNFLNWPTGDRRTKPIPAERIEIALRDFRLKVPKSYSQRS